MTTEHTKEPWRIGTPPPNGEQTIGAMNGLMVAVTTTGYGVSSEANARRIVACVNACADLPTDMLEETGIPSIAAHRRIEAQRDKLLEALKKLENSSSSILANGPHFKEMRSLMGDRNSARAAAKGGETDQGAIRMTTDRELLELAAKAAGYTLEYHYEPIIGDAIPWCVELGNYWCPHTDDGAALRLAVKLNIRFAGEWQGSCVALHGLREFSEESMDDPYAATRRAIVRAAAEIGRGMK